MNTPERAGWNERLFGLRVNEVVALGIGVSEHKIIPEWVWNVGRKLWIDFMGGNCPLPNQDDRAAFTSGFLLGALPNTPFDGAPDEAVLCDVRARAKEPSDEALIADMIAKMQKGTAPHLIFADEQLGTILRDFLQWSAPRRIIFASALLFGSRLLHQFEFGLISNGGSSRRTVLCVLWLNWEQFDKEESVAAAYRTLAAAFDRSGQGGLLGDWERFKKIAQEVGFRRRTRRKGKA